MLIVPSIPTRGLHKGGNGGGAYSLNILSNREFETNTKLKFAAVVLDVVLGPPCVAMENKRMSLLLFSSGSKLESEVKMFVSRDS